MFTSWDSTLFLMNNKYLNFLPVHIEEFHSFCTGYEFSIVKRLLSKVKHVYFQRQLIVL